MKAGREVQRGRLATALLAAGMPALIGVAAAAEPQAKARVDTIVVTGARLPQPPRELSGDVSVLTEQDIRESNAQSVVDLLRTVPGVQLSRTGGVGKATGVFLRGTNANQMLVLVDGVRIASATTGVAAWQNLPLEQIERIEVLRGPASGLYGSDAIGGVVQIFTRTGAGSPGAQVTVGIGSQDTRVADASFRGQHGATSFAVGAGWRRTDGESVFANPLAFDANPDRDGYENTNASASIEHRIDARHRVGASLLYARARNQYDSGFPSADFDYRNKDRTLVLSGWTRHAWQPGWTTSFRVSRGEDDGVNIGPVSGTDLSPDAARFRTQQDQFSVQNDNRAGPGTLSVGYEHLRQKVSGTTRYDRPDRKIDSLFAGYVATAGALGGQANVRHDHNSQYGDETTGVLAGTFAFASDWRAGASVGTAFRAPSFNELYFPGFGNPQLAPERSINVEAFVRYDGPRLAASVTAFRNRIRNMVAYVGPNFEPVNVDRAEISGVSLSAEFGTEALRVGGNLDLMSPEDASGGSNDGKLLVRRAERQGTLYAAWRAAAWDLRVEASGQGERFDNAANTRRMAGYVIVNVIAAYQVAKDWTVRLRVENLAGRRYELASDYAVPRHDALLTLSWAPR